MPRIPPTRLVGGSLLPGRVAAVTFTGGQILDVTGPLEVFSRAERLMRDEGRASEPAYQVEVLARTAGTVAMSSGIELVARRSLTTTVAIDTLIVCGGIGINAALADRELLAWPRRQQPRVCRWRPSPIACT